MRDLWSVIEKKAVLIGTINNWLYSNLHPLPFSIRNDSFYSKQKCTPWLSRGCIVSKLESLAILAWLKVWHAGKSPKYRAFLLPKFRKNSWKNEGWHWGILGLWLDLNPRKEKFWSEYRSKYRQISIYSAKNSTQSFGLGFSGFHEMWKHWNRVLFCFSEN